MTCGAAVRPRDLGLLVGADGADHGDAEGARPLAGDQADAAGGRVVEDRLAALQRIDLAEQVLRRHALHHQRRGGAVGDALGQRDQHVGRHHAHVGIGALRAEQVADAVAGLDVGDAGAHRLDDADGVGAEAVGQRQRIAAGAEIDVDEVDRHVGVAHARLAGPGLADLDRLELEHFGAAGLVEADGVGHDMSPWGVVDARVSSAARPRVDRARSVDAPTARDELVGLRPLAEAGGRVQVADLAEIDQPAAPVAASAATRS